MRMWRGSHYPRGATFDGSGVNFALFSEHATQVDLCLFDQPEDAQESQRIPLPDCTYHVFHGYSPDLKPGQFYCFSVPDTYEAAV